MAQKRRGGRREEELGRERLNNLDGSADKTERPVIYLPAGIGVKRTQREREGYHEVYRRPAAPGHLGEMHARQRE